MSLVYAMVIGFLLDCILGDPHKLPHPIRWIGSMISWFDRHLYGGKIRFELKKKEKKKKKINEDELQKRNSTLEIISGIFMVICVLLITGSILIAIRFGIKLLSARLCIVFDGIIFYYCIAPKSLYNESMKVFYALPNLEEARKKLSMIVGRDTDRLQEDGVIRACVETIAENTSDGVIAPFLAMAIGGPLFCMMYKAVNTMDSMVGYHNDAYEYFGKAAAVLDDICNYIPSRIAAFAMLIAAKLLSIVELLDKEEKSHLEEKKMDWKNAETHYDWHRGLRIWKRDKRAHKSPNSAQTESVCAGVLGIRLAGDAFYFGKRVKKPYIGDPIRLIEKEDIKRANDLMYMTTFVVLLFLLEVLIIVARFI